ncbi:MAG: hypothetical protein JJE23_07820 [Thermoleophilia bacterium]|nr:hypothetical protein [Thermoleophilia bacterium]
MQIKRQVFESFDLQIAYDKPERRVELSATVSEAVAEAFQNAETLLAEGCQTSKWVSEAPRGLPVDSEISAKGEIAAESPESARTPPRQGRMNKRW